MEGENSSNASFTKLHARVLLVFFYYLVFFSSFISSEINFIFLTRKNIKIAFLSFKIINHVFHFFSLRICRQILEKGHFMMKKHDNNFKKY